jgi:molybdopterin/thiamine biosynthesis adenylyltransferase
MMENLTKWYKKYPELYSAEIEALKNGFPGFTFIKKLPIDGNNQLVIVEGVLKITDSYNENIQIIFPEGYPYTSPSIIPFYKVHIGNGELMQPKPFHRGSQFNNGKICLYRSEEEWLPFMSGVGTALNQAKKWFNYATSAEGFPRDLIVDENPPLTSNIGQVLYYGKSIKFSGDHGDLLLKSFKDHHYALVQVSGENEDVITSIRTFQNDTFLTPKNKDFTFGHWYSVRDQESKNLIPSLAKNPENIKRFLHLNKGILIDDLLQNSGSIAKNKVIGFYFPNEEIIHFFQITYWKEGISNKFQVGYLLPKNLNEDLFARVNGLFDVNTISEKKILAIGLGAIGSEAVVELGNNGVGDFVIIDEEILNVGNIVRHRADLLQIGEKKVDVVKNLIQSKNPSAKVLPVSSNIFDVPIETLKGWIESCDIIFDFTAEDSVANYLNQIAYKDNSKSVLQASVTRGGGSGMVIAMVPGESICYECLKLKNMDTPPVSAFDFNSVKDSKAELGHCSKPALPGSSIDIKGVALQAARVSLQLLLKGTLNSYHNIIGYQYYWHGPSGSTNKDGKIIKPFEWEILKESKSICKECGAKNDKVSKDFKKC